jgi:hypothetical protein
MSFFLSFVKFSELALQFFSVREIGDLEDFTQWMQASLPDLPSKFTMLLYSNSWMEPSGFVIVEETLCTVILIITFNESFSHYCYSSRNSLDCPRSWISKLHCRFILILSEPSWYSAPFCFRFPKSHTSILAGVNMFAFIYGVFHCPSILFYGLPLPLCVVT